MDTPHEREMHWRLYTLETRVGDLRERVLEGERRLTMLEEHVDQRPMPSIPPPAPPASLQTSLFERWKETALIMAVGAMLGAMVAMRDPAGALLIAERLLGAK